MGEGQDNNAAIERHAAFVANDASLDDNAPLERASTLLKRGPPAASKMTSAAPGLAATKRCVARPARDLQHPANQRAGFAEGVRTAVTRASRPDVEIIISHGSWNGATAHLPLKRLGN